MAVVLLGAGCGDETRQRNIAASGDDAGNPEVPPSEGPTAKALRPVEVHMASEPGPFDAETTELVPAPHAWRTHTVTLTNTTHQLIYINDHRTGSFLGNREILAADEGCGHGYTPPGGAATVACRASYHPLAVEAGGSVQMPIALWRDLGGMNKLVSDEVEFRKAITYRTTRRYEHPADEDGLTTAIVLRYRLAEES